MINVLFQANVVTDEKPTETVVVTETKSTGAKKTTTTTTTATSTTTKKKEPAATAKKPGPISSKWIEFSFCIKHAIPTHYVSLHFTFDNVTLN